jgi:hypothetical protein
VRAFYGSRSVIETIILEKEKPADLLLEEDQRVQDMPLLACDVTTAVRFAMDDSGLVLLGNKTK